MVSRAFLKTCLNTRSLFRAALLPFRAALLPSRATLLRCQVHLLPCRASLLPCRAPFLPCQSIPLPCQPSSCISLPCQLIFSIFRAPLCRVSPSHPSHGTSSYEKTFRRDGSNRKKDHQLK